AGGAEAITVLPHDVAVGLPTPFARRIARNTQTLLSAESHVAAVADPAGGSAYVESLTDEIARAAWQWFGELDGAGGTAVALADGRIADRLAATRARRDAALATRELPLTGTSTFPLAGETLLEREPRAEVTRDGLPRRRDSEAFEALRERAGCRQGAHRPGQLRRQPPRGRRHPPGAPRAPRRARGGRPLRPRGCARRDHRLLAEGVRRPRGGDRRRPSRRRRAARRHRRRTD